jgi:hypothetical protein
MHITATHYTLGTHPVTGVGIGVAAADLDAALAGPIAAAVFDNAGRDEMATLLGGLADTDFARDNLDALLNDEQELENWRVGEAVAECYLTENRDCYFPWPDGRDARKRGSSLPGADLVGFQRDGQTERFAFGEVKTSAEAAYPPGVVYGRHGLRQQLEDLRDHQTIRDYLVKYLCHRAIRANWAARFQGAAAMYLSDPSEVRIFGLLIRDVAPHQDDLRSCVASLGVNCPSATVIELLGIYIPQGRIATLGAQVMTPRRQGGDQ